MSQADPIAALIAVLKADADVAALVTARVYGGELPRAEVANMPRACVVLKPAGGGLIGNAYQTYGDKRVDVACYADGPLAAWQLWLEVHAAMKSLRSTVAANTLIHWAKVSSDGVQGRDPDTDWPVVLGSFQVLIAETATA